MRKLLAISETGLTALLLHPVRSLATVSAILVVLVPYLVGLGMSKGIQEEAEASISFGADLYVSGSQFGQKVPVSRALQKELEAIEGVTEVVPRIVGAMTLGKNRENAVVLGLPLDKCPTTISCVVGRMPQPSTLNELVIGSELAGRLKLEVGSILPPFYRNAKGERLSKVVGVFRADFPLWQSRLVLTSLDTAAIFFDQPGQVSDFLVYCRPGYQAHVRAQILKSTFSGTKGEGPRLQVAAREELQALMPAGLLHREGIFNLHFSLAFAVGILAILVTSGFGLRERRREIGVLKATGWQTDEILLRSLVESLLLSWAAATLALLVAFVWLNWFNGFWIASIFLAGVETVPGFKVPFHLTPIPAFLAFLVSFVVVLTGSLFSSWRTAIVTPMEAMR
ncbi:MAG TPA: FtsX-like permease family protein [Gemmataceae bacterium]|nr:FtsX-like permease family protein [Gemmataceae bacterium]